MMRIGIIGAMNEEVASILSDMMDPSQEMIGGRSYYAGSLHGKNAVLTVSGWGKVAAASTATILIVRYGVKAMILCGVAGAAAPDIHVGEP